MSTTERHGKDSPCSRAGLVRDYAFDELGQIERGEMARHLAECSDCAAELDSLRLTTAALRVLPDVEVPRRIAFVSDKVFEPGSFGSRMAAFWNSAARLGFASACVLAVGISFAAWRLTAERPQPELRTVAQSVLPQSAIDQAVNRAVTLAINKTHTDDIRLNQAALDAVDRKYAEKQRNLMIAVQSNLEYLQSHYLMSARATYSDAPTGVRP